MTILAVSLLMRLYSSCSGESPLRFSSASTVLMQYASTFPIPAAFKILAFASFNAVCAAFSLFLFITSYVIGSGVRYFAASAFNAYPSFTAFPPLLPSSPVSVPAPFPELYIPRCFY